MFLLELMCNLSIKGGVSISTWYFRSVWRIAPSCQRQVRQIRRNSLWPGTSWRSAPNGAVPHATFPHLRDISPCWRPTTWITSKEDGQASLIEFELHLCFFENLNTRLHVIGNYIRRVVRVSVLQTDYNGLNLIFSISGTTFQNHRTGFNCWALTSSVSLPKIE